MKLAKPVDYAMRLCVDLAVQAEPTDVKKVAERQGAPPHYMAKVAQQLARAGIVTTARGAGGGVGLAVDPEQLTLLRIWEAVEGPIGFAQCHQWPKACEHNTECPYHQALAGLDQTIAAYLGGVTVAALAKHSHNIKCRH